SLVTKFTRPNLTSINQPLYDIGAIAMRMLTKIMHKEELENCEVVLNHGIKVRKSTK
ncbi:substrate-binding domain-containing protein, partial [Streptococcus suis]